MGGEIERDAYEPIRHVKEAMSSVSPQMFHVEEILSSWSELFSAFYI